MMINLEARVGVSEGYGEVGPQYISLQVFDRSDDNIKQFILSKTIIKCLDMEMNSLLVLLMHPIRS